MKLTRKLAKVKFFPTVIEIVLFGSQNIVNTTVYPIAMLSDAERAIQRLRERGVSIKTRYIRSEQDQADREYLQWFLGEAI